MRTPKPWYWEKRKGWYVQIDGKQRKLGPADAKTKKPPEDVMREFHRLMMVGGMIDDRDKGVATVPEVIEAFIESKSGSREKTVKACLFYLNPFARQFKARRMASLKAREVSSFVESQAQWGETTRYNAFRYIKSLFKWAKEADFLESNPLAVARNPYHAETRERGISQDEMDQMIGATKDEAFRAVLRFFWGTGCRPAEFCQLTANHLHPTDPVFILKPGEHKTGGRTGKKREIFLPESIEKEARELAKLYPSGPLYRNTRGEPWKTDTIEKRITGLRKKLGLPGHVIPYGTRHGFLTRIVLGGTDIALAAKIAGHAGIDVIQKSYFHPDRARMIDAVNKNAGNPLPKPESAEEKIARLEAEVAELRAKANPTEGA